MVGVLLTITALAVLQLALALLGAQHRAGCRCGRRTVWRAGRQLACRGRPAHDGTHPHRRGGLYTDDVDARLGTHLGTAVIVVTVRAPFRWLACSARRTGSR